MNDNTVMIKTVDLRVDYGDMIAVAGLNLSIERGEIYGLIGPNGAGKTSTFRVLSTLLEPTYGDIYIGGFDIAEYPREVHRIMGYMPDIPVMYDDLKVWEFFDLFAGAYFVQPNQRRQRVDECLESVNLTAKRDALAGTLSRGMKQRLLLGKTLLHRPTVLLLDEPAGGLDPMARIELRDVLRKLAADGCTILVSSHILTELADFCSSMGIMEKGHLILDGKLDDIRQRMKTHARLVIEVCRDVERAAYELESFNVQQIKVKDQRIEAVFEGDLEQKAALLAHLIHKGLPIVTFYEEQLDVEDIFLKVGARQVN
jgi:ABC-2 type transport system ATP-binding protein